MDTRSPPRFPKRDGESAPRNPKSPLLPIIPITLAVLLALLFSTLFASAALAQTPEGDEPVSGSETEQPPPPTATPIPPDDGSESDSEEGDSPKVPVLPTPGPTRTIKIERHVSPVGEGDTVYFKLTANIAALLDLTIYVDVTGGESFLKNTPVDEIGMAKGDNTAWLILETVDDEVSEDDDDIVATVEDGSRYNPGDPSSATITVEDDDAPAPDNLTVTSSDEDSVNLSWDAVDDAYFYKIERWHGSDDTSWQSEGYRFHTVTTYAATGLECGTYYFRVRTRGDGDPYATNYGSASSSVSQQTVACIVAPAPDNLTVPSSDSTSVDLSWGAVVDAYFYKIERWHIGKDTSWQSEGYRFHTGTTYSATGLDCGTYYFRVSTRGDGYPYSTNYGSASSSVSQQTVACIDAPLLKMWRERSMKTVLLSIGTP